MRLDRSAAPAAGGHDCEAWPYPPRGTGGIAGVSALVGLLTLALVLALVLRSLPLLHEHVLPALLTGTVRKPRNGQQQRLCLARGLAVEPEALLCDEPTASLDPLSAQHVEQLFVELKRDYTIVLVTHILRQAKRLADYIVFFYMGELVEHGPAEQVFSNPRDERTRKYLEGVMS